MRLSFQLKHHFFSAFREFFVHHHGSIEFRAKVFALMITVNPNFDEENYNIIRDIGLNIYKNDEERADLLMITTKENVKKVNEKNSFDIDILVTSIQKELKIIPRYAKKIERTELEKLLANSLDKDVFSYQQNILEFLDTLKEDTLNQRKKQIAKDEKKNLSQIAS